MLSNIFNTVESLNEIKDILSEQVLNSTLSDFIIPYNTIFVNNNKVFNDLFVYFFSTLETFYDIPKLLSPENYNSGLTESYTLAPN